LKGEKVIMSLDGPTSTLLCHTNKTHRYYVKTKYENILGKGTRGSMKMLLHTRRRIGNLHKRKKG
jgi:hypothetical protein